MLYKPLYCRSYQQIVKAISGFLPWREPVLLDGEGSLKDLAELVRKQAIESILIVTDKGIAAAGLLAPLLEGLQEEGIHYAIYDKTVPNPTLENVEEAVYTYHTNYCEGRSEEHTSELQSRFDLVCRLLLEKKKR